MNKTLVRPMALVAALAALLAVGVTAPQTTFAKGAKAANAADKRHGKVTAVDTTASTITLHNKKLGDMTFTVTPATKIKVNKAKATLTDVKIGMVAGIRTTDGKTALAIHAHDKKAKGAGGSAEPIL